MVAAVRGTHEADQSKSVWDQMECNNSEWCLANKQPLKKLFFKLQIFQAGRAKLARSQNRSRRAS